MRQKLILFSLFLFIFSKSLSQNIKLNIFGSTPLETEIIDSVSYVKMHSNFKSISTTVDSLKKTLQKIGYIELKVDPLKKLNDTLFSSEFHLNKKYEYLYIKYSPELLNTIKTTNLKLTDQNLLKIPISKTEEVLTLINSKITEQGFPFTTISLINLTVTNNQVEADLKISDTQQLRTIDNIIIKGYENFPEKFISNFINLKPGKPFNKTNIITKAKSINNLPFANLIRDPEVLFTKDSTTVYLYIEKQKSNNFDGYLGFTTNEDTNKLEFSGYLNMLMRNNLNLGESLKLIYRSDENEQRTFNIAIDIPYIFKSPIGTKAELNIFKKDSSFTTVDQSLKLYYVINQQHQINFNLKASQSNNLLKTTSSLQIEDYKKTFYNTAYTYQRNNDSNTQLSLVKSYFHLEAGTGHRTQNQLKESQFQINGTTYHNFNLNNTNSIYGQLTGAALFSDNTLENELFRFGGINSIRGFEENSLSATLYGVLNLEYRLQLSNSITIHSITDFSYLENNILLQKEKLFSFGIGFMILTKSGVLKFNFANGKSENTPLNISNSKIHRNLTTIF